MTRQIEAVRHVLNSGLSAVMLVSFVIFVASNASSPPFPFFGLRPVVFVPLGTAVLVVRGFLPGGGPPVLALGLRATFAFALGARKSSPSSSFSPWSSAGSDRSSSNPESTSSASLAARLRLFFDLSTTGPLITQSRTKYRKTHCW